MRPGSIAFGVALLILLFGVQPARAAAEKDATDEIVQKNLFSPERAPAKVPQPQKPTKAAQPQPPPEPPPSFTLYGVIIVDERPPQAILEEPRLTGGRSRFVTLGEQLGSYVVAAIEPERVVLRKDGASVTVNLLDPGNPKKQGGPKPVLAAPAPAARPAAAAPAQAQAATLEAPAPTLDREQMRSRRDERRQQMLQMRQQRTPQAPGAEGAAGGGPARSGRGANPFRGGAPGAPGASAPPMTQGQGGSLADIFQGALQRQTGAPQQPTEGAVQQQPEGSGATETPGQ